MAMASDWLQLDAVDDWVRHDSGIVSSFSNGGHLRHDRAFGMSCPKKSQSMGAVPLPDDLLTQLPCAQALHQEVGYASYLNIPTVILPPPRNRSHVASYGRIVNECLRDIPYMHFSVRLPIYDPAVFQSKEPPPHGDPNSSDASSLNVPAYSPTSLALLQRHLKSVKASEGELNATWEMWDVIRTVCDNNVRLTLSER